MRPVPTKCWKKLHITTCFCFKKSYRAFFSGSPVLMPRVIQSMDDQSISNATPASLSSNSPICMSLCDGKCNSFLLSLIFPTLSRHASLSACHLLPAAETVYAEVRQSPGTALPYSSVGNYKRCGEDCEMNCLCLCKYENFK